MIKNSFPSKSASWEPKLKEMIPSFGTKLNGDAHKARENMAYTAKALELWEVAAGTKTVPAVRSPGSSNSGNASPVDYLPLATNSATK